MKIKTQTIWLALLLILGSCSEDNTVQRNNSNIEDTVYNEPMKLPAPKRVKVAPPLLICCSIDKSKSDDYQEAIQITNYLPIIEYLKKNSGQLSVTYIADDSRSVKVFPLRITKAPYPPLKVSESNPFIGHEKKVEYDKQYKLYEEAYQNWKSKTDFKINSFLFNLSNLLDLPRIYKISDVYGSINKCNRVLCQPDLDFSNLDITRYLIVISDLESNSNVALQKPDCDIEVILINTETLIAPKNTFLATNNQFINIDSAIRFIIQSEKQKQLN